MDSQKQDNHSLGGEDAMKYVAFISYRHSPRDHEVACIVQRAIESFRLPRGVASAYGVGSRSLGKCFRDEDELSASHSLPESIKNALAQSGALIVVCSPEAKESPWVQREIEEYIRLHGRERIFSVLSEGDTASSIPEQLKGSTIVDVEGVAVQAGENPFAADLRSSKRKGQISIELLRIIAALSGCDYDELRQRERVRRRKMISLIALVSFVVIAFIAGLIMFGARAVESHKISESKEFAAQSQLELAQGDRIRAIQLALDGLPSSSVDGSRPLVGEAETALREAVQANPDPSNEWRASFVLEMDANVVSFTSSEDGEWAGVLDEDGGVRVFDLATGAIRFSTAIHELAHCDPVTEGELLNESPSFSTWGIMSAGADCLLLFSRTGAGDFVCLDVNSGEVRWAYEQPVVSSIAVSQDGEQVAVISVFEDVGIKTGLVEVDTGNLIDSGDYGNQGIIEAPFFYSSVFDSQTSRDYIGIAGYVLVVDFNEGMTHLEKVNDQMITGLFEDNGTLVVASWHSYSREDLSNGNYIWEAAHVFGEGDPWKVDGEFKRDALGTTVDLHAVFKDPAVHGFLPYDGVAVVVTAGNQLRLLRPKTGEEVFSKDYFTYIVGFGRSHMDEDREMMAVVTADGRIELVMPSYPDYVVDATRTQLPCNVGDATIKWYCGTDYLAIIKSLEPSRRLLVYRLDPRPPEETVDLSFDEVVAEAQEIVWVNAGGKGRKGLVNHPEDPSHG